MKGVLNYMHVIRHTVNYVKNCHKFGDFLKNFSIIFLLRGVSILFMSVISVIGGRSLSVDNFAKLNLIINMANFLVIPMIFGVNVSILKILPDTPKKDQPRILGIIVTCNLLLSITLMAFYGILTPFALYFFKISTLHWMIAIVFAALLNFSLLVDSVLRYEKKVHILGLAKIISSGFILILYIITIVFYKGGNVDSFLIYNTLGQGLFFLVMLFGFKIPKLAFSLKTVKKIYKYSFLNMSGWLVSSFLFSIDIYLLPRLTSYYDLGIYSVYQVTLKNYFNVFFHDIFAVVFLPAIIDLTNSKSETYKKIIKYSPLIFIVISLGSLVVSLITIKLFGKQYELNWLYVSLVSIGIGLYSIYSLLNSTLIIDGLKGAIISLTALLKSSILYIINIVIFTKFLGIKGTMLAFIINQLLLILLLIIDIKRKSITDTIMD